MDIGQVHIGMKLRNPLVGRVGEVTKITCEGGLELVGNGLSWHEHVENVVPVSELHIGDYVRATGKSTTFEEDVNGKIGIIDSFMNDVSGDKCADIRWLCGSSNLVKVAQLTYVHPVCESCEMARVITSQCKPIAELQKEQCRPLAEVAKCYVQVEPEKLFLSQDAKRVIEYLAAMDTPISLQIIYTDMGVYLPALLDALVQAREAGVVRLDDGKYSLVRD